jgi:hypothetical protein
MIINTLLWKLNEEASFVILNLQKRWSNAGWHWSFVFDIYYFGMLDALGITLYISVIVTFE